MTDDAPAEPRVERVERPDGRYVLYFSWLDAPVEPAPEPARDEAPGADE